MGFRIFICGSGLKGKEMKREVTGQALGSKRSWLVTCFMGQSFLSKFGKEENHFLSACFELSSVQGI